MRSLLLWVAAFAGCAHATAEIPFLAPPVQLEGRPLLIYDLHVAKAETLLGLEILAEPGPSILRTFAAAELGARRSENVFYLELAAAPAAIAHRLQFGDRVETSAAITLPAEAPLVFGP